MNIKHFITHINNKLVGKNAMLEDDGAMAIILYETYKLAKARMRYNHSWKCWSYVPLHTHRHIQTTPGKYQLLKV